VSYLGEVPKAEGVADFYCHEVALVIEVDGDIHDLQKEDDTKRDKALSEIGLKIVRFRNDEILNNLLMVVKRIKELALR
jgi:very-short-patch-repair endonuclease